MESNIQNGGVITSPKKGATAYENLPAELTAMTQWVCARDGSKLPLRADGEGAASSADPSTWSDFNTALRAVEAGRFGYCGFVLSNNGIIGIDIDTGYDDEGFLSYTAADIIGECQSYTERSRSGRGFHILVKGDIPFNGRNNRAGVEIYKAARYFIMTGKVLIYRAIVENQAAIDYVLERYFNENISINARTGGELGAERGARGCGRGLERIYSPVWELPSTAGADLQHGSARIPLRPTYPTISQGCRNISLTSLAGSLHKVGYDAARIYDELDYVNQIACRPPLDNRELRTICNSVMKYK